ncbi:SDR family oxidoreductase [Nocardia nova]|uniref:SDR family oxidoreductase n=1 Tax=Nocardia nova TaxID=37330 RepID=UPI0034008BA5
MMRDPRRRLSEFVTLSILRPPRARNPLRRRTEQRADLTDKRVLITGASSGIGEAAAELLAGHGARIAVVARRREPLDALVARVNAAGGDAAAFDCDLSDLAAVDSLAARVEEHFGGVDVLINNAAHSIRRPLAESLDRWHDVERMIQLNYYAPLRLIRALAPGMRQRGDGHIINVSTWGVMMESTPLFGVYNASKAALSSVSRIAETEWIEDGVHTTTLYYPLVKTAMSAPTKAFEGRLGLSPEEAAGWMLTAVQERPVRIAPRIAVAAQAVNSISPPAIDAFIKRRWAAPKK